MNKKRVDGAIEAPKMNVCPRRDQVASRLAGLEGLNEESERGG